MTKRNFLQKSARTVKKLRKGRSAISSRRLAISGLKKIFPKGKKIKTPKMVARAKSNRPPVPKITLTDAMIKRTRGYGESGADFLRVRSSTPSGYRKPVNLTEELSDYLRVDRRGPFDLIEITLSPFGVKELLEYKKIDRTYYIKYMQEIRKYLNQVWTNIARYGMALINRYVPKDTGQLRRSLNASLSRSASIVPSRVIGHHYQLKLRMGFNTSLDYAPYANEMPNRTLRHFGLTKSSKGPWMLNDPFALFHFMSMVKLELKKEAKASVHDLINNTAALFNMRYNTAKKMFKIQRIGRY